MVFPSRVKIGKGKYCSRSCASKDREHFLKTGHKINQGRKYSESHKNNMSKGMKGKTSIRKSLSKSGKNNPNWKDGITPINKALRNSKQFSEWRKAVFKRDNYTCQICGARGVEIHPDHIKRFSDYPALRFDVSNGRTLCKPCHIKTDTWGNKKMKWEQQ
jgi:5-methylcytosine-specific restriction endonuclease McrA